MIKRSVVVATCAVATLAAAAWAERSIKMYDLRDVAAVLPARDIAVANPQESSVALLSPGKLATGMMTHDVPILSDIPIVGMSFRKPGVESAPLADQHPPAGEPAGSPTQRLVGNACGALGATATEIVQDVYIIEAEDFEHAQLAEIFENVRALYKDRVEITVSVYEVDSAKSPAIGAASTLGDGAAMTARTVAARKSAVPVIATRDLTYISRLSPIVGDSAVGLEPGTSQVTDGLTLVVRVTGTEEQPRASLSGMISKTQIEQSTVPADQAMAAASVTLSPGGPLLAIGLPRTERRSLRSDVGLEPGRPVVACVTPSFAPGKSLVVTLGVRTIK